jgi:hypothetical protein
MKNKLTKKEKDFLREKFIIKFCKENKWNYNELTTGQMLIITKQPGFKNLEI